MAHFILEYSANLEGEADMSALLRDVNAALIALDGVFPTGGIRARALALQHYAIADSQADYAFAHATLKIGAGRSEAQKKAACEGAFEVVKAHYAEAFARRYLALSLELVEFSEAGTLKHNNIHARFKKPA